MHKILEYLAGILGIPTEGNDIVAMILIVAGAGLIVLIGIYVFGIGA